MPNWEQIVEQYSDQVFRLAYRLTGDRHDAEDLTQEVFLRVFRSLDRFEPGNFDGWLRRITTNLFLDQARRKQRLKFSSLPQDGDAAALHRVIVAATSTISTESLSLAGELDDDIEAALAGLPAGFREAVVLCDVRGLSQEEASELLGVKINTIRTRIHRGRTLLRRALAHRAPTSTRTRFGGPRLAY